MNSFVPKIKNETQKPDPRNVLSKLPSFLQEHADVKRFFSGVANHFFEPAQIEEASGFIGRRSTVFNPNDFYIKEATSARQNYQLEPATISKDSEENINYYRFYEDLVDNLRVQGANTKNHSRLFESEYWSWCPPINPDMLINFSNYYWLEEGPPAKEVTEVTNVVTDMISQSSYTYPDGTLAQSGQRVIFRADENTEYNNVSFLVVNVGRSIRLIDDSEFDNAVSGSTPQDYIVMERGAIDHNAWSTRNRWFHRNQIQDVNLTNYIILQAKRPIIQYEADIQLRNMGRKARKPVNLLLNSPLSTVQGKSAVSVDGVLVEDGMRILVTGASTAGENNLVYLVTGLEATGVYVLVKEIDGQNIDGTPANNEVIRVLQGVSNANKRLYWNGSSWATAQVKPNVNSYPSFELYDLNSVPLDDIGIYPESTFDGSAIFGYKEDNSNPVDSILGLRIQYNTFGELVYDNFIQSDSYNYQPDSITTSVISGMKFFRINGTTSDFDSYESDWRSPNCLSRQAVSDTWTIKEIETNSGAVEFQRTFTLSQIPEPPEPGCFRTFLLFLNGELLEEGTDYDITDDQIELSLTLELKNNDFLEARSFDKDRGTVLTGKGFYRVPTNLQANPQNESIETISYNQMFEHLVSLIENQQGITGKPYGVNNYNSTSRNLSAGTEILQHSAPMLKLMFLNQNKEFNIRSALRFASLEYERWYSKFEAKVRLLTNQDQLSDYASVDDFIDAVLTDMNTGKDNSFPFKNSGMIGDDLYIPPTPAYLGVGTVWEPVEFLDDTISDRTIRWRRNHDGSLSESLADDFDNVMLRLETRIYNSINDKFKAVHPEFGNFDVQPGNYRASSYLRDEWDAIMRPLFETWATQNGVDHKPNTWYDSTDPFTFNYGKTKDRYGNSVPGYWRGIYRYYFDTDRPHSHPWEMLGMGEKPTWWDGVYGSAPYTRENTTMWRDLENGYIAGGSRQGIDRRFTRPGLSDVIPVDAAGLLLDPIACGIIPTAPPAAYANQNFKFGDVSPIEWLWRNSNLYSFDLAVTTYLARPAEWLEKTWDAVGMDRYFRTQNQTQFVYTPLGRRTNSTDDNIHTNTNREIGSQQWISDFWLSKGLNQTTDLENKIKDLTVQLGYRAGAFINSDGLKITADNFGLIPAEDISIVLNQSASRREPVYSGLIIQWDGTDYRIRGYDSLYPVLRYFTPNLSGTKSTFSFGKASSVLYSKFDTTEKTYEYNDPVGSIQDVTNLVLGYGSWLESEGWVFDEYIDGTNEINNWNRMAKEFVKWASDSLTPGSVIFLSPFSSSAAFQASFGLVDKITQYTNGSWTALDHEGVPIRTSEFKVSRIDNQINISHTSDFSLALLRLTIIEYEHAIIFNNETKFGNLIYDPSINLRQRRFRLIGNRVKYWNGRFDAPGYLITDETIIPNYDTNAEDIRKFYDPYSVGASSAAFSHARHLVGYQKRNHMDAMLVDDRSQFNFFRGFLAEKGTSVSFDRLMRSTFIRNSQEDFELYEEWAFKLGEYGAREIATELEFALLQSDIKTDPQTITFTTDSNETDTKLDQIITIPLNDARWVRTAEAGFLNKFPNRNFVNSRGKDLPTAGWARLGDTSYIVSGEETFDTIWEDQNKSLAEGDTVWVVKDAKGDWDIRRFTRIGKIISITAGNSETDPVTIRTNNPHGLSVGDPVIVPDSTLTEPDYKDTQIVSSIVDAYRFKVSTPATSDYAWTNSATSNDQSPVTGYGKNLIVNGTNILFTTDNNNEFATTTSPQNLNLGGLTLTVDGDTVTFIGNTVTGLTSNPKIRSTDVSTSMIIEGYPVTFDHTNSVGSVINPTVTVDGTTGIYINGTDVVWTGAGDLDSIVADINNASISRIFADKTGTGNNQLRIWNLGDDVITLRNVGIVEDALEELGFAFNSTVTGTSTSPSVTVDASNGLNINGTSVVFTGAGDAAAIVNDINTAAITNITAVVSSGAVQITHGTGGDIYIYDLNASEDSVEIIGFSQSYAGKTTSDYVAVINLAVDTDDIEATVSSSKIALEKKNGGSVTISDVVGSPSVSFGFQKAYPARTLTQIVAEMTAAGMPATEETDTSISFSFSPSDVVSVSGTATTTLGLSSEYRAVVSYADIVNELNSVIITNIETSNSNGYITFTSLLNTSLTFGGSAAADLGFDSLYSSAGTQGPDIYYWITMRRNNVPQVGTLTPIDGWVAGDMHFVNPDTETNLGLPENNQKRWAVYSYNGSAWVQIRYQEDRIDTPVIESVILFDEVSKLVISNLSVWDPVKRFLPATSMTEIYYLLEIDPAVYTNGSTTDVVQKADSAWGISQTGRLWWDLNAVRYLDYEQGDLSYRRKYWGRKLPGSSIDVYEWTRSPVPPSGWDDYVVDQSANASSDYLPSGTVKNPNDPAWVESIEFDKVSQQNKTFYYFWVLNPRYKPNKPFRQRSAFDIKRIIESPKDAGITYFSPIFTETASGVYSSSFIVGNITNLVTNDDAILQINFNKNTDNDDTVHNEWELIKEGSTDAVTPVLWKKMKDSLVGYDDQGLVLPDANLNESRRYGIQIRPRQSMFIDRSEARREFVAASNLIFVTRNIVDNDEAWATTFLDKDAAPNADFTVNTRLERNALISNPLLEPGMSVLVLEDEQDKFKWSHWSWDGSVFALLAKEEYDMQNFWNYLDWYDTSEVSSDITPTKTYTTLATRNSASHVNGEIVQVLDNGEGRWIWTKFNDNTRNTWWSTVAIQAGTIALNSALYEYDVSDSDLETEARVAAGKLVDFFTA